MNVHVLYHHHILLKEKCAKEKCLIVHEKCARLAFLCLRGYTVQIH